jgi:hypothetical protein
VGRASLRAVIPATDKEETVTAPEARRPARRSRFAVAIAVAVVLVGVGSIASASIPDARGVLHGCYAKINGALRIIDTGRGQVCSGTENSVVWSQRGPTGAQGVPGPAGPQGTPGAQGADGAKGATGPVGPAGVQGPAGAKGATGAMGPAGSGGGPGPAGSTGGRGPTGAAGPTGPSGSNGTGYLAAGTGLVNVTSTYPTFTTVASIRLPAGDWVISTRANVFLGDGVIGGTTVVGADVTCQTTSDTVDLAAPVATNQGGAVLVESYQTSLSLEDFFVADGSTAFTLQCTHMDNGAGASTPSTVSIDRASFHAIPIGSYQVVR